ncbi:MAG: gfo/Idh/MocA family oxidoreductase, partial [Clostridiales bacterium]|nr:gfo/Idh/MocA family oxidoreductase [Clostridiales bacterium]
GYEDAEHIHVPDTDYLLPDEIKHFTLKNQIIDDQHVSFIQGSGHGGSHPHLVQEFVTSCLEGRKPHVSAKVAANWNVAGILGHESCLRGGEIIDMPEWAMFED